MTEKVYYLPSSKNGKNRAYTKKACEGCGKVTFIWYPGGRFCTNQCVPRSPDFKRPTNGPKPAGRTPRKVDFILALDPGGARCGYAIYEHEGADRDSVLLQSGIIAYDGLTDFLQERTYATVVVCESYIIRPGLNHGSSGKTIKAIGQIEMWAKTLGKPLFLQRPDILPIAHKITGIPKPKGHLPDDKSAILHGAYWLAGKKWYLNALERKAS